MCDYDIWVVRCDTDDGRQGGEVIMTGKGSYHGHLPNTRDLNNLNTKLGNKNQKIYCNRFLKHVILDFSC